MRLQCCITIVISRVRVDFKRDKVLPRHGQETWQTTFCSPIIHCLQFTTCDVTSKEALITDNYYWHAAMGGTQKIQHASFPLMRSRGDLDVVSVVIHYDALREIKQSIVAPDVHWLLPSLPTPYVILIGLLSGWNRAVWPRHNLQLSWLVYGWDLDTAHPSWLQIMSQA